MNAKQANKISIEEYLETKGIAPVKTTRYYSLYHAPYRADHHPSMKVGKRENLWIDFGTNEGGTLIDLVLKMNPNISVSEGIREVEESTSLFFSFHQQESNDKRNSQQEESRFEYWNAPDPKHDSETTITNTKYLKADREKIISKMGTDKMDTYNMGANNNGTGNPCYLKDKMATDNRYYLIHKSGTDKSQYLKDITCAYNIGTSNTDTDNTKYLKTKTGTINIYKLQELGKNQAISTYIHHRGISLETARPFCKEIYYSINHKRYFGLANKNNKGWSLRNKYWKGCTAQGYSYYQRGEKALKIFEGIFDLLSYLELNFPGSRKADILVLNSLVNLKRAIPIINSYPDIALYLDNDDPGRKTTDEIIKQFPQAIDKSGFYNPSKDLNEYHLLKLKE